MSEREIREFADDLARNRFQGTEWDLWKELRRKDPDVVAVLRSLKDLHGREYSMLTKDDKALIGVICRGIEGRFGVRLTDGGWEWVEEGSDAE